MKRLDDLVASYPPATDTTAEAVRAGVVRQLVVLDDDPTGTQSVADLPVLNSWSADDLAWALGTGATAVYVMTNSRSLDPDQAAARNREVVRASLVAAERLGVEVDFVSRSDSTLRGHFPLEPDVIATELAAAGQRVNGMIVVPAFGDAGRITIGGVHYAGSAAEGFVPVGESEFARDASFGYHSSYLPDWIEEKSQGRISAESVIVIDLGTLRGDPEGTVRLLTSVDGGAAVVVDIVTETDLRLLALAIQRARNCGSRFIYRVGPPFVRAMIGQQAHQPLTRQDIARIGRSDAADGGLIVVGSHVDLTTRQLNAMRTRLQQAECELDVERLLAEDPGQQDELIAELCRKLPSGNVVLRTSRTLVRGGDAADSLRISREVSDGIVAIVRAVLDRCPPRFVIAKGGITSSDVASRGLEIGRAMVRGPMLPGIVSLWEPIAGPAVGIPYVVFAGNVGNEQSLADVVVTLSAHQFKEEQ